MTAAIVIGEDISSEDSNIVTYFQSFDKDNYNVSPRKDLSQTFASIELLIKNEFDYDNIEQVSAALNKLYNLLLNLLNNLAEFYCKLHGDFNEYYETALARIFARIFTPKLFHAMYNLDSENIDLIWQIYRILELLYTPHPIRPITSLNGDTEFTLPICIPTKITIVVIKYLQLPLFKFRSSKDDIVNRSFDDGDEAVPCEFFRGFKKKGIIIDQKLVLMDKSLESVLRGCEIDPEIVSYFHSLLINKPTYFSFDMYTKNVSIILDRVSMVQESKQNTEVKNICLRLNKAIAEIIFKHLTETPFQSNLYYRTSPHSKNYQPNYLHQLETSNKDIVPNWVRYFEYLPKNFTQVNSDYTKNSKISPKSETKELGEKKVSADSTPSLLPELNYRKKHNRLKFMFKEAFGIPNGPYISKDKKSWLKRNTL